MLLADYAVVSDGKLTIVGGGWSQTGPDPAAFGIEGRINFVFTKEDAWDETLSWWRDNGASHVSFNTMGVGLKTPDEHITALRRFMEAARAYNA